MAGEATSPPIMNEPLPLVADHGHHHPAQHHQGHMGIPHPVYHHQPGPPLFHHPLPPPPNVHVQQQAVPVPVSVPDPMNSHIPAVQQGQPQQEEEVDSKQNMPNPWEVDTLKEFCFYCCPECDFRSKSESPFQSHALKNHPKAQSILAMVQKQIDAITPDISIKEEDVDEDEQFEVVKTSKKSRKRKSRSYYEEYDDSYDPDFDPFNQPTTGYDAYDGGYMDDGYTNPPKKKKKPKVVKNGGGDQKDDIDDSNKPHGCDLCSARYSNLYALAIHKTHLHDVGGRGKYPCPACGQVQKSTKELKSHLLAFHEDGPSGVSPSDMDVKPKVEEGEASAVAPEHKCQHCDQTVRGLWDLTLHLRQFHKGVIDDVGCPACDFKAANKRAVKTHILREHEKNFVDCPGCDKVFLEQALKEHVKRVHSKLAKEFKCHYDNCEFVTKVKSTLYQHFKFKHEKHKFICDLCGKTFPYNALLKKHKNEIHLGLKSYVCDKCGKGFGEPQKLQKHRDQPSCDFLTNRDTHYKCDECDMEYDMLKAYIAHHKRCHGSFPPNVGDVGPVHLCDQCPAVYLSPLGLKNHKAVEHLGMEKRKEKPKNLKCPHCDKIFQQTTNYKEHILSKHENNTPFKCEQCPKSYGTENFLRMHINNTHRRPKCPICSKEICNKLWLKRHMAKEHGVLPENSFPCDVCSFVFDTEDSKIKHMMKQHASH